MFIGLLLKNGASESAIELMAKVNPAKIVGRSQFWTAPCFVIGMSYLLSQQFQTDLKVAQECYLFVLIVLQQSLQYTGLPSRGSNGTSVSLLQLAHTTGNIWRSDRKLPPPSYCCIFRARRHDGQRFGSLVYPLEAKNSCSSVLKTKSSPQSEHWIVLSAKSIG